MTWPRSVVCVGRQPTITNGIRCGHHSRHRPAVERNLSHAEVTSGGCVGLLGQSFSSTERRLTASFHCSALKRLSSRAGKARGATLGLCQPGVWICHEFRLERGARRVAALGGVADEKIFHAKHAKGKACKDGGK